MIVLSYKFEPSYFWFEMDTSEVQLIVNHGHHRIRDGWEQARLNAYYTVAVNSKKVPDIQNFIPFHWEKKNINTERLSVEDQQKMYEQFKNKLK